MDWNWGFSMTGQHLLPKGELTDTSARGTDDELGPMVSGVYDDGKGKAAVSMGFYRTAPEADGDDKCPDKVLNSYDDCTVEVLPGGG